MSENTEAAYEGLRHLARTAENDRLRFRSCEYLLGVTPLLIYHEGYVDPKHLPPGAVPTLGENITSTITRVGGAEI